MKKWRGVLAVTGGSVLYGIQPLLLKESSEGPMSEVYCTFFRFVICTVLMGLLLLLRGQKFRITKRQTIELACFGAISYALTNHFMFLAFKTLSVITGTMCHYAYPAFVLLGMIFVFRERCTVLKTAAVIFCLAGLLTVILSDGQIERNGLLLALFSAVTYAVYIISNDQCTYRSLHDFLIAFYVFFFTTLLFAICALASNGLSLPCASIAQAVNNLLCSVVSTVSICCLTYGIKTLGASMAAFLCMWEPLTSVLLDVFVLRSMLSRERLAGTALILLAMLLIAVDNWQKEARTAP